MPAFIALFISLLFVGGNAQAVQVSCYCPGIVVSPTIKSGKQLFAQLRLAAAQGDRAEIKRLIKSGAPLSVQRTAPELAVWDRNDDYSPLEEAIHHGQVSCLKYLFDQQVMRISPARAVDLLALAIDHRQYQVLEELLKYQQFIRVLTMHDENIASLVEYAIEKRDIFVLTKLLGRGAFIIDHHHDQPRLQLIEKAIATENLEIGLLLISYSVRQLREDRKLCRELLSLLAKTNSERLIRFLLDQKYFVFNEKELCLALAAALRSDATEAFAVILAFAQKNKIPVWLSKMGHKQQTLLMIAARYNQTAAAILLLKAGAQWTTCDEDNLNAAEHAFMAGHEKLADELAPWWHLPLLQARALPRELASMCMPSR